MILSFSSTKGKVEEILCEFRKDETFFLGCRVNPFDIASAQMVEGYGSSS